MKMMRFRDINKHPEGAALAYQLLKERGPEVNISHVGVPTFAEHVEHVKRHPSRVWLVIEVDGVPVGTISLSQMNEIGIFILREHQRKGYATAAIQKVMEHYPPLPAKPGFRSAYYIANVAPANMASHALFTGLGAKIIQHTYRLEP